MLAQEDMLTVEHFPDGFSLRTPALTASSNGGSLKAVLQEPEKRIIIEALDQAGWNRKKAATLLNINRTTLYNKMKKYNLVEEEVRNLSMSKPT